jgi:hypothetical protein
VTGRPRPHAPRPGDRADPAAHSAAHSYARRVCVSQPGRGASPVGRRSVSRPRLIETPWRPLDGSSRLLTHAPDGRWHSAWPLRSPGARMTTSSHNCWAAHAQEVRDPESGAPFAPRPTLGRVIARPGPSFPARQSQLGPSRLRPVFVSQQNPGIRTSRARFTHGARTSGPRSAPIRPVLVFPEHAAMTAAGGWRPRSGGDATYPRPGGTPHGRAPVATPHCRAALTRCNDSGGRGLPHPHPPNRLCRSLHRVHGSGPNEPGRPLGRGGSAGRRLHPGQVPAHRYLRCNAEADVPATTATSATTALKPGTHTCRVCTIPSVARPAHGRLDANPITEP